jgi:hypothetical protein
VETVGAIVTDIPFSIAHVSIATHHGPAPMPDSAASSRIFLPIESGGRSMMESGSSVGLGRATALLTLRKMKISYFFLEF